MRNLMSSNKTHISKKIFIIISYAHTSGGSVHELAIMMINNRHHNESKKKFNTIK